MSAAKLILRAAVISGVLLAVKNASAKKDPVKIYYVKTLSGNYNAKTIPPFGIYILESEKENVELLNHELIHWNQYLRLGLINYYAEYVKELNQFGYDLMPMEIEARANEPDLIKTNYTQAVRNGTAKTVFNPNFRVD